MVWSTRAGLYVALKQMLTATSRSPSAASPPDCGGGERCCPNVVTGDSGGLGALDVHVGDVNGDGALDLAVEAVALESFWVEAAEAKKSLERTRQSTNR